MQNPNGLDIISSPIFFTEAQSNGAYKLVWADEFNRDGTPDSSTWNYETGFVRNEELQWYQPQNAFCENGRLIIEAKMAGRLNPMHVPRSKDWRKNMDSVHYTSACLITKGHKAWQYGRFVMRAKIDINKGLACLVDVGYKETMAWKW